MGRVLFREQKILFKDQQRVWGDGSVGKSGCRPSTRTRVQIHSTHKKTQAWLCVSIAPVCAQRAEKQRQIPGISQASQPSGNTFQFSKTKD